jgi:hypothetical protein
MPLLFSYILGLLLRVLLLSAGLVFAAGLAVFFAVLLVTWWLRALWGRATGRPAAPFSMKFGPREGFDRMARRAQEAGSRTPRADSVNVGGRVADVTDVKPK